MVFAPAIGIAALQALAGLCAFVAALLALLLLKQVFVPNADMQVGQVALNLGLFALGGLGCLWGARKLRAAARSE
jgi:predicted membrane-bound spermidine synthase